jgi:hypothetical protein
MFVYQALYTELVGEDTRSGNTRSEKYSSLASYGRRPIKQGGNRFPMDRPTFVQRFVTSLRLKIFVALHLRDFCFLNILKKEAIFCLA